MEDKRSKRKRREVLFYDPYTIRLLYLARVLSNNDPKAEMYLTCLSYLYRYEVEGLEHCARLILFPLDPSNKEGASSD